MVRRARPLPIAAAAFGWVFGLYALPLAHNVNHRNDHTHGPAPAEHVPPHEEGHPHAHPHAPEGKVPLDSDHGTGSVLHFAAAALSIRGGDLPQVGPRAFLPPPPSPRVAPSIPARIVLVRGPPVVDFL